MKKEELVHLHMLLGVLKKYCEETGLDCNFEEYRELGVTPFQVHHSKEEHTQAIFTLATALATTARFLIDKNKKEL